MREVPEDAKWWSSSNGKLEMQIGLEDAQSGSHSGDCQEDVEDLRRFPYIKAQLDNFDADEVRRELDEYGCWVAAELEDDDFNLTRLLWLICGQVSEEAVSED